MESAPLRHRRVKTDALGIHFAERGEGPLLLLCHGFFETSYAWRRQMPDLAEAGFRVVAPDMRGYGRTDAPAAIDEYTVFHLVGDMVALLDALEERTAIIVGNDWGATVAWQCAQMRPDRFRGVAAISVPLMGRSPVQPTQLFPQTEAALHYTLYFQPPGIADAELDADVRRSLRTVLFSASGNAGGREDSAATPNPFGMVSRRSGLLSDLPDPPADLDWLTEADLAAYEASFRRSGFTGGLNYYRNLDCNWQLQASLSGTRVEVPSLFMVGERDPGLSIPGMRDIIAAMPELAPPLVDSILVPGQGHWLPQESPDVVKAAIIDFARRMGR